MKTRDKVLNALMVFLSLFLFALLLGSGTQASSGLLGQVRVYTRDREFDFVDWTLDALWVKFSQMSLGTEKYMPDEARRQLVIDYLKLIWQIEQGERQLQEIYADPQIADPETASIELRADLDRLRAECDQSAAVAEAILQEQIGSVASQMGLSLAGQPIPPVLYHSTPLPWALIVSPRNVISQEADISLVSGITLDQQVVLEEQVDSDLDVSSLVVGIGGIGLYPTMVDQTSNINWLSEVIAHEWIHNFLTLRPLGLSYFKNSQLRTMNETAAAIAGKEISRAVLETHYPEFLPSPSDQSSASSPEPGQPPAFDFYSEMRETRVRVDQLLAEGKIEEAERYMEERRIEFWDHGYHLRKLNQAYFAFHGAYADHPSGGAAGVDPVGEAVRQLRSQSASLAEFINRISWMSSFEELQKAVAR